LSGVYRTFLESIPFVGYHNMNPIFYTEISSHKYKSTLNITIITLESYKKTLNYIDYNAQ